MKSYSELIAVSLLVAFLTTGCAMSLDTGLSYQGAVMPPAAGGYTDTQRAQMNALIMKEAKR